MGIRIALAVVGSALASLPAHADKDKHYSVAELKALVDATSYDEALGHLDDVGPLDRKADWQDVAGRAAAGAVGHAREPMQQLELMIAIEERYPSVVKHAMYNALRTEVGPKGFGACFDASDDPSECRSFAIKFVDDDAANGTLALAMAKVARKGMNAYGAVPLFARALAANKGAAAVCKDEDLRLATVAGVGLEPENELQVGARALAVACWSELRQPLIAALAADDSGYTKHNTCELLAARKQLVGEAVALCAP